MRPHFLFIMLITLCSLLTACGDDNSTSSAANKDQYNWKMVTTWPPNFPVLQEGAERFAKNVETASDGRIKIQVFAGGELIPALQAFDAVSQGTVEMSHGSAYYWAGKVPEAQFFSGVPFGMTAEGMNTWLYEGGGLELWREVYQPFHVIPFPLGNTGPQMGGWFNKEINSIEDIQGLKMRIPGLGGKVFAKAGGNPVLLAGSEVYTALERNTIDATEWIGPFHDQRLGLYRAAKHYYYPGWHEPGTVLELGINQRAWESLPANLQAIIRDQAKKENLQMLADMDRNNRAALTELKALKNIQIHRFPDDVIATFKHLTDETLTEAATADPKFARVYQAYQNFRQQHPADSGLEGNYMEEFSQDSAAISSLTQEITVYRSPTCNCCKKWMSHLEENGFIVKDKISMNLASVKDQLHVPHKMNSCHTALIGDYIIEGHVPADDIKRLLLAQPDINGLAVPEMPIGSPGMEHGDRVDPYTVFSFKQDGKLAVFNQYPKN